MSLDFNFGSLTIDASNMKNPMLLAPCGHGLDEERVKEIFFTLGEYSTENRKSCPTCKVLVTGSYPNLALRTLLEKIVSLGNPSKIVSIVPKNKEEEKGEKVKFPGTPARFAYSEESGENFQSFKFTSTTKNSLFTCLTLIYHSDKSTSIVLYFDPQDCRKIKTYFTALGIQAKFPEKPGNLTKIEQNESLGKAFNFLTEENSLPQDKLHLFKNTLVDSRKIT